MNQTIIRHQSARRAARVRAKVFGVDSRPRLAVRISNRHIWAQIIDDQTGKTLATASSLNIKNGNMTEKAAAVAEVLAEAAKKNKIGQVVMDRGSRLYHQRLKAFADTARKKGLKF